MAANPNPPGPFVRTAVSVLVVWILLGWWLGPVAQNSPAPAVPASNPIHQSPGRTDTTSSRYKRWRIPVLALVSGVCLAGLGIANLDKLNDMAGALFTAAGTIGMVVVVEVLRGRGLEVVLKVLIAIGLVGVGLGLGASLVYALFLRQDWLLFIASVVLGLGIGAFIIGGQEGYSRDRNAAAF